MPRQSSIKEHTRRQVDDRETFDYTTPNMKVAANPVDPYAKPGAPPQVQLSGDVKAFQDIMTNLQGALIHGVGARGAYEKTEKKRGQADAAQGKKDEDGGAAYLTGHEIISGKAAAADLEAATADYYDQHKDDDPATFKTGMERLHRQFLNGRSEAFTEGILSDAINIEQKYGVAYHAYTVKKTKEEGLAKLGKGFDYDIGSIAADTSTTREEKAKAVREMVTGMQYLGEATYGLTKNEVSDHVIGIMRRKAIELADPDMMKFAWEPDKDGVRLIDQPKLAQHIDEAVRAADTERTSRSNEFEKRVNKMKKDVEERVGAKISELLLDGNADTKAAHDLLYQYSDLTRNKEGVQLNPAYIEHAHRLIASRGAGFALQSDADVLASGLVRAGRGELTLEDIRGMKRSLEESDWKTILGMNIREQNEASKKTPGRKDFESKLGKAIFDVKQVDPITGRLLDPNGAKRSIYVNNTMLDWWQDYKSTHEGKEPPAQLVNETMRKVSEEAYQSYEPLDESGLPTTNPNPAPAANSKPKLDNQTGAKGPALRTSSKPDLAAEFDKLIQQKNKKK